MTMIGIGDGNAWMRVHCPHRPPLAAYEQRENLMPAASGELDSLVTTTGNHWRKIINLYAKLMHELNPRCDRWQTYRDRCLLRPGSGTALVFSAPDPSEHTLTLVMGQAYALHCGFTEAELPDLVSWQADFRYSPSGNVILTPYFDYRQLSNAKLESLVELVLQCFPMAARRSHHIGAQKS